MNKGEKMKIHQWLFVSDALESVIETDRLRTLYCMV
jgi:hypothetical protein